MRFRRNTEDLKQITGGRWDSPVALLDSSNASRQQELMGEYGLVEAILREAIREYQKFAGQQTRRGARLFREVHQWFLADDREWDFSFINVCQILNLEPTYIRTGLKLWCERHSKPGAEMNCSRFGGDARRPSLTLANFGSDGPALGPIPG